MKDINQEIRVLLVEDDAGDAILVSEMLAEIKTPSFVLTHVDRVATAMQLLLTESFGVILLDLSLPDGHGLDLVKKVRRAVPETPIVVMSGQRDDDIAMQVVQAGVQDYCVKGHVDSFLLARALRYAIERKRIEEELRRSNAELAMLYRVSATVSRSVDMNRLLDDVIDTITGLEKLDLERKGSVFLVQDEYLKLAHDIGHHPGFFQDHQIIKSGECLCGLAAATGEMIVCADAFQDARHTIHYAGMEPHGHVIVPLKVRKRVIGVLCLYTLPDISINDHEKKMLLSIGEQVAIAIENARLYEETRLLALHDHLTGLANRRHLDIVAETSLAMARRYGTPFSVIMLDLDHFKLYNDTHGHSAGDQLLKAVARTMKQEVRDSNLVVRYGGEEFLVLLQDTEIAAALLVAERLRLKINENTGITVSLGVSSARDALNSMAELIVAADTALYQAKNSGRNRVVSGGCAPSRQPFPHP